MGMGNGNGNPIKIHSSHFGEKIFCHFSLILAILKCFDFSEGQKICFFFSKKALIIVYLVIPYFLGFDFESELQGLYRDTKQNG